MSFATVKAKQGSERWTMARLTVARDLTSYLTVVSGNLRSVPWTHPVVKIELNGVVMTKDTSQPSVDGHWYWDEAAGVLYVYSTTPSSSNMPVVFFYLFTTSGNAVDAHQDPTDSATPVRQWEPRLLSSPKVRLTIANILAGIFSVEDTQLDFANADGWFAQFCADTDSINEKDVDLWIGVRSSTAEAASYQRIYRGRGRQISLDRQQASVEIHDVFSSLKTKAFMGDTADEAYFTRGSGSFPDTEPNKSGTPCRYFTGPSSRHKYLSQATSLPGTHWYSLDADGCETAICIDYNPDLGTSVNRTWVLGRMVDDIDIVNCGAVIHALDAGLGFWLLNVASTAGFYNGDTLYLRNGGTDIAGVIISLDTFTYLGIPYNVIIGGASGTITTSFSGVNTRSAGFVIDTQNGDPSKYVYLRDGIDFTWSIGTTSGGNRLLKIVFINNFEAGHSSYITALDPGQHKVCFRMSNNSPEKHGALLKKFCQLVGLETLDSSFSDADTTLPVNTMFSIPFFDEQDFDTYQAYASRILASTPGYISLGSDSKARYDLIVAPTSTDDIGDETILDSDGIRIDYQDIVSQLIAYNPHNASEFAIDASPSPSETRSDAKALYLHGVENTDRLVHVLETITGSIDVLMAIRAGRRNTYSASMATKLLDGRLGQDFRLTTSMLLGVDTQRAVKTTFIEISADDVSVEATDLEGL